METGHTDDPETKNRVTTVYRLTLDITINESVYSG